MKLFERLLLMLMSFTICFVQCDIGRVLAAEVQIENETETENVTGEEDSSSQDASEETDDVSGELEVILNIDENVMSTYIEGFEQKYPDVKVKYTRYSDYEERIKRRIENNNYGDVLFMPAYIDSSDVAMHFEPLGDLDTLSYKYNYLQNSYKVGNTVYSLPSSAYLMGIIYNKAVFYQAGVTEIPKTTDDFLEDLKMVKERTDAIPFYTCHEWDWTVTNWVDFPFIEMTGDADYRGLKFVYEKDPFLKGSNYYKAYKLLYDIVAQGLCEDEFDKINWGDICNLLNAGDIGSVVMGSWALSQVRESGSNGDSISFMPFPNEIDGKQYATIGLDYGYCINKNSDNKEAARKFVEYMIDESGYAIDRDRISIVKTDPYPSVYGEMGNVVMLSGNPFNNETYNYYNKLVSGIDPASAAEIRNIMDVAAGIKEGDYDKLMRDWNNRWEAARPSGMHTVERESGTDNTSAPQNSEIVNGIDEILMDNYEVKFSPTEQEYISEKKQIRVGYLTKMAPFQYEETYENGTKEFKGLSSVMCKAIEDSTQMQFEYIPYSNTESMVKALKDGKIDLAAGFGSDGKYYNDVRLSKDYLELSNVILKSDSIDINKLSGSRQAYVTGDESNIKAVKNSKKVGFDSCPELIAAIEKKQADYAVLNYYSASYYVKDGEYSEVALIPLTEKTKYSFAFAKNVDTRLVSICNKCIYSFPEESIQMTLMQYMDPQPREVTLKRFIDANPLGVSIFCMLLLIFILGVFSFIRNEKERNEKKHEVDTKRYEILSQLTDEYVFEYDFKTDIIHFDEKFDEKFGFGNNIKASEINTDNEALIKFMWEFDKAKTKDSINSEPFELVDNLNQKQWYRMIAYRIIGDKLKPQHLIGKLMNVQQIVEEKQRIQEEADRDSLTALYNRTGFEKKLAELMEKYPQQTSMVFAVLDIDDFKAVNDSLGHVGGDEALKRLASKLLKISSENVITARYGGDEFMICMFDITKEKAEETFKRLVKEMDSYVPFQGNSQKISISLGGVYVKEILPLTLLFVEADKVLYCVKTAGKNNYKLINHLEEI